MNDGTGHYARQLLHVCQQDVEPIKTLCFFRLHVFLKEEELPQIPAKLIRKSLYLPFSSGLMEQEVTVMRGSPFPV